MPNELRRVAPLVSPIDTLYLRQASAGGAAAIPRGRAEMQRR